MTRVHLRASAATARGPRRRRTRRSGPRRPAAGARRPARRANWSRAARRGRAVPAARPADGPRPYPRESRRAQDRVPFVSEAKGVSRAGRAESRAAARRPTQAHRSAPRLDDRCLRDGGHDRRVHRAADRRVPRPGDDHAAAGPDAGVRAGAPRSWPGPPARDGGRGQGRGRRPGRHARRAGPLDGTAAAGRRRGGLPGRPRCRHGHQAGAAAGRRRAGDQPGAAADDARARRGRGAPPRRRRGRRDVEITIVHRRRRGDRALHLEPPPRHPRRPVRSSAPPGSSCPYSCSAWIDSIRRGVDVARAAGRTHVAGCTGSTSERTVAAEYGLPRGRAARHGRLRGRRPQVHPPPPGRPAHPRAAASPSSPNSPPATSTCTPPARRSTSPSWPALARRGGADGALAAAITDANTGLAALQLCRRRRCPPRRPGRRHAPATRPSPSCAAPRSPSTSSASTAPAP